MKGSLESSSTSPPAASPHLLWQIAAEKLPESQCFIAEDRRRIMPNALCRAISKTIREMINGSPDYLTLAGDFSWRPKVQTSAAQATFCSDCCCLKSLISCGVCFFFALFQSNYSRFQGWFSRRAYGQDKVRCCCFAFTERSGTVRDFEHFHW